MMIMMNLTIKTTSTDPRETTDTDGDGVGNNADRDDDGDGYADFTETLGGSDPLNPISISTDTDKDRLSDPEETLWNRS